MRIQCPRSPTRNQFHRDIDSLTNFKRRTSQFLKKMKKTGQPMVLTVHGKAEKVVRDPKTHQNLLDRAVRFRTLEAIHDGMKETKAGKGRPTVEAMDETKKKFRFSGGPAYFLWSFNPALAGKSRMRWPG